MTRPTIKAAASFVGLGVLSTDHYAESGGNGIDGNAKEWFINTVRPSFPRHMASRQRETGPRHIRL